VQIIDEKTHAAIVMHPLHHWHQRIIAEMMTEKGRKNNVGFLMKKIHLLIIRNDPGISCISCFFFCKINAFFFFINACQMNGDIVFCTPFVNRQ
jgi:hypothetical protein